MIVEGFWRAFKHGPLASFSKPRLDFLIHLIITSVISSADEKLKWMGLDTKNRKRRGRPKPLAPWQKDFKRDWVDQSRPDELRRMKKELTLLQSVPKGTRQRRERQQQLEWAREESRRLAGSYFTSLEQWTCSCPSFLISRFLSCKHLVREANRALGTDRHGLDFFKNLRRHHTSPFYHLPGIHSNPDVLVAPSPEPPTTGTTNHPHNLDAATEWDYDQGSSTWEADCSEAEDVDEDGDSESLVADRRPCYRLGEVAHSSDLLRSGQLGENAPGLLDVTSMKEHGNSIGLSRDGAGLWSDWDGSFVDPDSDGLGLGDDEVLPPSVDGFGKVSSFISHCSML
jgi:hypothetical protein